MTVRPGLAAALAGAALCALLAGAVPPAHAQRAKPLSLDAAIDAIARHMVTAYPLQAPHNNLAVLQFQPNSGGPRRLGEALMQKVRIRMFDLDAEHRLNFVSQGKVTELIVSQGADAMQEIYDSKRRVELGKLLTADHFVHGTYELAQDGSAEIVAYLVEIESGLIRAQKVVTTDSLPEELLLPVAPAGGGSATGAPAARSYRVTSKPLRSDPEAAKKLQMAQLFEQRGRKDRVDALNAEILADYPDSLEAMQVQARFMMEDVQRLTAERRYDGALLESIRAIPPSYATTPRYRELHDLTLTWLATVGDRELEAGHTDAATGFYKQALGMGLPRSQYDAFQQRVKTTGQAGRADGIRAMILAGDRDNAEVKIVEWEVDEPRNPLVKQLKKELDRPEGMVTIKSGSVQGRDVDAFNLDIYETTNKEFLDFVKENPKFRKGAVPEQVADVDYLKNWSDPLKYPPELDNRPIVFISQQVAAAYCNFRKKRLPTSDEWGLAAGEGVRKYAWGDKEPTPELANYDTALFGGPLPGESHPLGRTPEGVYHMSGNVWEITSTVEGGKAVARGGCYFDKPEYLQVGYRGPRTRDSVSYTSRFMGVRCAQ